MDALNRGYYVAVVLAMAAFGGATYWLLNPAGAPDAWWHFFLCGIIGVLTSVAFVCITQYYTEYKYRPVQSIAEASKTGPATNIIAGVGVGLECTWMPALVMGAALLSSYYLGQSAFPASSGLHGGLFGTAVATMGMLATAAYILAMDTFGPITDNAGGIVEMSEQPEEIRKKTDRLDAVGNTTKALTKGYAVGSAALAAFLLFQAYMDEVTQYAGQEMHASQPRQPGRLRRRALRRGARLPLLGAGDPGGGRARRRRSSRRCAGSSRSSRASTTSSSSRPTSSRTTAPAWTS